MTQLVKLAIDGGKAAVVHPLPKAHPGAMRIGIEEEEAVLEVLRSKRLFRYYAPYGGSSKVKAFEEGLGVVLGAPHVLAVGSGTSALSSSLAALEIGPGDEVVVPAYTWIATAASALAVGAVPTVAEVDAGLTLDPESFEEVITPRTRAVIAVHMRGAPARMGEINDVAKRHGIAVVEDVAQAMGGTYQGQRLGTLGDMGAFSLQFNKIITAGEGGAVATADRRRYERARMYHDVSAGLRSELATEQMFLATTCRLSELQGAVALVQLGRLEGILADLRRAQRSLTSRLAGLAEERGVTFRRQWDAAGDTGLTFIFYAPTSEIAHDVVRALRAEGVPASLLFSPDTLDFHVAYHWRPLISRSGWAKITAFDLAPGTSGCDLSRTPRSMELLARAVQVEMSPEFSEQNLEEIGFALEKVLTALPEPVASR